MTRTAGALIGRRRSSAFWGLGCPKTHHEIKDSLVILIVPCSEGIRPRCQCGRVDMRNASTCFSDDIDG
ncbi:MAG: hypothetical protein ABW170_16450 [Candidatus Thiodiazotropha sp. L084R]